MVPKLPVGRKNCQERLLSFMVPNVTRCEKDLDRQRATKRVRARGLMADKYATQAEPKRAVY